MKKVFLRSADNAYFGYRNQRIAVTVEYEGVHKVQFPYIHLHWTVDVDLRLSADLVNTAVKQYRRDQQRAFKRMDAVKRFIKLQKLNSSNFPFIAGESLF